MNMSFRITEGKYCAIDADDYLCHGYYINKNNLSSYTIQADMSIDGQVISSGEIVCKGNYLFPINIKYNY